MAARLELAETIRETSIGEHEDDWAEAIASVKSRLKCPRYLGLEIEPQVGLVPIGRDSDSGLWEFCHLQTGKSPQRDADGRLVVTAETGLVFVLIPGGVFWMGAETEDEAGGERSGPNIDRDAEKNERPQQQVELDAFFLSKYEMTQAQWMRFTGKNPSFHRPDKRQDGQPGLLCPVENVSWEMCARVLDQLGLVLPTEAQWEYACRAGTSTPWWTGKERQTLEGKANLADQAAYRKGARWAAIEDWPELDDGYPVDAPVGTFGANPFGLHDVHGNVWEWVRDRAGSYRAPTAPGDGERRQPPTVERRVIRGGSFGSSAAKARSSNRDHQSPGYPSAYVGLRPARKLVRS